MIRRGPSEYESSPPVMQMAPFIDIVFIILIFYITLSVFYQLETELSISVPKSEESKETTRSPGEIIINVNDQGRVTVNQKELKGDELEKMLKRVSALYPSQPVIIRADKKTYHEQVVKVLDACAAANIWNIAFSTIKDKK